MRYCNNTPIYPKKINKMFFLTILNKKGIKQQ